MEDEDLLAEQRSYYRARAPEYDEWWQRRGRFDRGEEELLEWGRQVAALDGRSHLLWGQGVDLGTSREELVGGPSASRAQLIVSLLSTAPLRSSLLNQATSWTLQM